MRAFFACSAAAIAAWAVGVSLGADRVAEHLKSENYTVKWGAARTFDRGADLEIGDGAGHAFKLGWLRFKPGKGRVDVLSIDLNGGWHQYRSKWPPDLAPVSVKCARMNPDAYAALLHDLARIDAAVLHPVEQDFVETSSQDFWADIRLTAGKKTLVDVEWAGYWGTGDEVNFAKPQAAVAIGNAAVEGLEFKAHTPTPEERAWASAKFARDWKRMKGSESHWWVREEYIVMIGVAGDASALPALRGPLAGEPKDRCAYFAVNAITRLTGKDVRDKPVEEMDVEKTRRRLIDTVWGGK